MNEQRMLTNFKRVLITLMGFNLISVLFYLLVYFLTQPRVWQALPVAGLLLVALVAAPVAYRIAKMGNPNLAGVLTLLALAGAYGINELSWIGLTWYHIIGGSLIIMICGSILLPQKPLWWLLAIISNILLILVIGFINPISRYPAVQTPALQYYALFLNVVLALAVLPPLFFVFQTWTIRARLTISFILLVLLPVAITMAVSSYLGFQTIRDRVLNQLESITTLKTTQINTWTDSLQTNLAIAQPKKDQIALVANLMKTPNLLDQNSYQIAHDGVKSDFDRVINDTGIFEEIFLVDPLGKIILSTQLTQEGKQVVGQPYFQEGFKGYIVTAPYRSTETNQMTIVAAAPLIDQNGQTIGLLAGRAKMTKLSEIMSQLAGLGSSAESYLVSNQGILLSDLRYGGFLTGQSLIISDGIGFVLSRRVDGRGTYSAYYRKFTNMIGAYHWLPRLQVALIVEEEESEALQPIYQSLWINAGVALIAVFLALLMAMFAQSGVTRPLASLTNTARRIAEGDLQLIARIEQEDEIGALAKSFNSMTSQLRSVVGGLEERINERTDALERQSLLLQVAAEVARDTAVIRDLNELLNRAVTLIRQRFGFYHAGIFLLDEQGVYAVLQAATGEAGREMLNRGHQLRVGEVGIVGYVTQAGLPRVASEVDSDVAYYKNPLLPETRSEAAIPLKLGSQIIGAIDVQSTQPQAFDTDTLQVLQTMADQLAVAIENARLFKKMEHALDEVETVYGRYTRESWANLAESHGRPLSYRYRGLGIEPLITSKPLNPEAIEALQQGRSVVTMGTQEGRDTPAERLTNLNPTSANALAVPLKLRGQVIGVINLRFESRQPITPESISTYEEIANRLALVLENARLLQDAQHLAAREQQINLISNQVRKSANIEAILQSTVRELGKAMGVSRTFIQLGIPGSSPSPSEPVVGIVDAGDDGYIAEAG